MNVTDEMVEVGAISDAAFDGRDFAALGRADKARYRERSRKVLEAALAAMPQEPVAWRDFTPSDARYCSPKGTTVEVQVDDQEYRQQFEGEIVVGSPRWNSFVSANAIVRWRPLTTPAQGVPAVKALPWQVFCSDSGNCAAKTEIGEYVIQHEDDGWRLYLPGEDKSRSLFPTLEAAEAAAQADFERRIRSCLTGAAPSPSKEDDLRAASKAIEDLSHELLTHRKGPVSRDLTLQVLEQALIAIRNARKGAA